MTEIKISELSIGDWVATSNQVKMMLNLIQKVRNFALAMRKAAEALREQTELIKLLKIAKPKKCDYINYIHYITNRERVKQKIQCSFCLQKNYTKLQRRRRSVLKTTNKNV